MRLLRLEDNGDFSLVEYVGSHTPQYAILSHTWGLDHEEVTFKDMTEGTFKNKASYRKLAFCGKQAAKDGLEYFWVDTCCIDKSSSAELTEAINSMFRWYQDATRCYVYLSDVSVSGSVGDNEVSQRWIPEFKRSRWFTRGWTLQELIAPASVEFFSEEEQRLGSKRSLEQTLHEITGIAIQGLRVSPLTYFSVNERMSWAAKRQTKREEDEAYCLLGIFNIHMPLIYGEGRKKALVRLRKEIKKSLKDKSPTLQPALFSKHEDVFKREKVDNAPWIVPFDRNRCFTGREPQLVKLEENVFVGDQTAKIAITGLGGVGKTQLVLELAYRIREKYKNCSVFWIPATNMGNLHQTYLDIAQQLSIPGWEEDKVDVKRLVQSYLSRESAGQWLLVYDNADDINMWIAKAGSEHGSGGLIEYLPRSKRGSVVFTTRDRKTAVKLARQSVVEVPEMDEDAATQLLRKCLINSHLVDDQQSATAMLSELTYLPLAIVQAAAYINENGIAPADYLLLLAAQEEEVVDLLSEEFGDDLGYHSVKNPVATTWLISFQQILRRDPLAAGYLSFMACINPKDIPQFLLPAGPSRKKETDAIGTLNAYSFITRRSAGLTLNLHRLVHLATRNWLRKEKVLAYWTDRAVARLEEAFPDNDPIKRSIWRTYLPHGRYVLESDQVNRDGEARMDLAWKVGMCMYSDGRYDEAEVFLVEVMETSMRVLGDEHPDTLASIINLAATYRSQGRWKKAEELLAKVIETSNRVLGEEHPHTLTSINNLAMTYTGQGRWKEAKELLVQVMETRKRVLGEEHLDTLTSINNLAMTYMDQGRWKEAEELLVQVMETGKRVFGEEHPNVLVSMGNLAMAYTNQGQWKEVKEPLLQVVETSKRVLGEEHPYTLTSINNLALTYTDQGRWKEAEELLVQVMETRKRRLGEEHLDVLASMANLASTLWKQGRWEEAIDLEVQVMETRKRVLGEEHLNVLASMGNLALAYRSQGRWKEAEELLVKVIETTKRVLGEEHPDVLDSMGNLALAYRSQGRWEEAEELLAKVIETSNRVLGEEHLYTLTSINNLALTYTDQGRWKEAEELLVQVMETRKRVLGEEHLDVLDSMDNLAETLRNQGRYKGAEELLVKVIETSKRVLGEEHPDVLASMGNLASTYSAQGRWKEAEELEAQVMKTSKRVLGEEHPDTLASIANLTLTWIRLGRKAEAIELMEENLHLRKRISDSAHPDTVSSSAR